MQFITWILFVDSWHTRLMLSWLKFNLWSLTPIKIYRISSFSSFGLVLWILIRFSRDNILNWRQKKDIQFIHTWILFVNFKYIYFSLHEKDNLKMFLIFQISSKFNQIDHSIDKIESSCKIQFLSNLSTFWLNYLIFNFRLFDLIGDHVSMVYQYKYI